MGRYNANSKLPRSKGTDMGTLYMPKECAWKAKHLILPPLNRQIVQEFITIIGMKERFELYEVPVPNKVVLFGPPGSGKTLTAFHLADRLQLPLILVRLDAIIHSHLGETASNIRKIFDYARSAPCVLFLDEFDAVARTRDNNDDVKEMARTVNTLLQCLDEFEGDSIFVAATNLEAELDTAIWRRFDTRMTYSMPDEAGRNAYIALLIENFEREDGLQDYASHLLTACSFADLEQTLLKAKRKAIIEDRPLSREHLDGAFAEYKPG